MSVVSVYMEKGSSRFSARSQAAYPACPYKNKVIFTMKLLSGP